MKRKSGILMPMSSLPSPYGIGTIGKCAYRFVDFLKEAGQKYWQLLPLCPTGFGDSPYSSFSTFAGSPYYIDLDMLVADSLITAQDINEHAWADSDDKVNYGLIYQSRFPVLRKAFSNGREKYRIQVEQFRKNNAWVENYALFMAVKNHFNGAGWTSWEDEGIRLHKDSAVREYSAKLADEVDFWAFLQYIFFKQWDALKTYAHKNGIEFIGDVPIYVALDSADVWSEPRFFQLDEKNVPKKVAGVPPDAFTEDGQLWGNPLYDWDLMKADGYGWWIRRIEGAKRMFDVIRIDHFRGFESYWAVPYGDKTAKNGNWVKGPDMNFVGMLKSWFHDTEFIAEDLGFATPEVAALLKNSGFPGMKVLEFAFDPIHDNDYLTHNQPKNSVCYVGTHDNHPVSGWLETTDKATLDYAKEYMNVTSDDDWAWAFIRTGMMGVSNLFVMQMQDVLELGPETRMNAPGTAQGNWAWRMLPDAITPALAKKIYNITKIYKRL